MVGIRKLVRNELDFVELNKYKHNYLKLLTIHMKTDKQRYLIMVYEYIPPRNENIVNLSKTIIILFLDRLKVIIDNVSEKSTIQVFEKLHKILMENPDKIYHY